ncbi:methyltransferase domain-containing protein [Aquisphaera insulae]|uniref:methyltransferase domain-containing protein n=1 Tax=Aquisphaera insulae TaxID=2712864 RepID=UPI0013EC7C23|nr:methyltransferase domain-containing protein [Aquisphaera insulae]
MSDDLASGFRDVDRAADLEVFTGCLELVNSIPFFAECKRQSYGLLGAAPGRRILDVGCGLGEDAAAMARLVAPGGTLVGVDGSRAMVEAARGRHGEVDGLSFEVADAASLPFDDMSFDACRVDRVLQHVADPAPAIREMARVLRPGGVLVAYDNDWETLTVDSADRPLTRTVLNAWCDRFPSGWIGRQLVSYCLQAGLGDVEAFPRTLVLRDLAVADRLYCFFATVERLAESGRIRREDAMRWSDGLRAAGAEGRFFCSYTGFLVRGVRGQGEQG